MVYNEKIKEYMLRYQRKLREKGLYIKCRSSPQAVLKNKQWKYEQNAILCVKKLFGESHLI